MPILTVIKGENQGASCEIVDEVLLGRAPEKGLVVKDVRASRKHARVVKINGEYFLEDLNSQNGTLLNGRIVKEPTKLASNDNIRIGTTWIQFILDQESLDVGGNFLNYTVLEQLVKEDSGDVYRVTQSSLDRTAILWALAVHNLGDAAEQAQQNFIRRISTVASLFHRNIMMLLDFAVTDRYFYCAFEDVDFTGHVKNYLKKSPALGLEEILDMSIQIARGMSYAHEHKVLHLHLTSKEVLLQTEAPKRAIITGFGISRFLSELSTSQASTQAAVSTSIGVLGVSEYIAPEQVSGRFPESEATDVYAFGCLLYHILSGNPPFPTRETTKLVKGHLEEIPRNIQEVRKDTPGELAALVHRCMAKTPDERPSSFEEIVRVLEKLQVDLEFEKIVATPTGQDLLRKHIGERTLWKWWAISVFLSLLFGILAFCSMPLLLR